MLVWRNHRPPSAASATVGLAMSAGHSASDGQLVENQTIAASKLPVDRSAPSSNCRNLLPPLNIKVETRASERPLAAQYARATVSSCSLSVMGTRYADIYPCKSRPRGKITANRPQPVRALSRIMIKRPKEPSSAEAILKRIDSRIAVRKARGLRYSDRAISIEATGSPDTLRGIRRNIADGVQTGISTETVRKLAKPLASPVRWLLTGEGPEDIADAPEDFHLESEHVLEDAAPPPSVPLIGYVSAGAQAVLIHLPAGELDRVPAPPHYNDNTRALEVRGDSLGALFDRWLVFYDDVRSPITPDLINKLCIVGLADGRILIKKVRRNRDGAYDLLSNAEEPIKDVVIEWAALVKSMEPR